MIEVRYSKQSDAVEFYGGHKPIMTFRGVSVLKDGEVIAIGGVARTSEMHIAFAEFKPEVFKHKRKLVEAAQMGFEIVKGYNEVFAAVSGNMYPTARTFIKHFGFKEVPGYPDMYKWRSNDG